MHIIRKGAGKPLILIHGLGSSWRSWAPVLPWLERERELILVELPGHGTTPAEEDSGTFAGLVRSFDAMLEREGLAGTAMAGASMGARLVLEMARLGKAGAAVALDPGGFWAGWERAYLKTTLTASVWLLRGASAVLPALSHSAPGRSALLLQLSARPWALDGDLVETELESFAATPTFDALVEDLAYGPPQEGPAADPAKPLVIGWGRHDRLCLPVQAARAAAAFPSTRLHWFEESGHFPAWDQPEQAAALILETVR